MIGPRALVAAPLLLLIAAGAVAAPACADPCVVTAHSFVYAPATVVLESGDSIRFTSLDTSHTNTDGTGVNGMESRCFLAAAFIGHDSPDVRFDIDDDRLTATVGGTTRECDDAQPLPDGSFALPFFCRQHSTMRGTVVVTPAA